MAKNKILIVGHGGTLAMAPDQEGDLAPALTVEDLLKLAPRIEKYADIDLLNLENKDSVNLHPTHWLRLAATLLENGPKYDGFVVTHGTDTMTYTASAVAMILGKFFDKPVVFTGSQMPMVALGNDGVANFERAVLGAADSYNNGIAETMIFFDKWLMRAVRTVKTNESRLDAFDSPVYPATALFKGTGFDFNLQARSVDEIHYVLSPDAIKDVQFNNSILNLSAFPGLKPSLLQAIIEQPECLGVVFNALGAGNIATEEPFSLREPIEQAKEMGKPFIITTQFVGGSTELIYATGKAAIEAGAITAGDMTSSSAVVKLMHALGEGITYKNTQDFFHTDFVGEVTPHNSRRVKLYSADNPRPRLPLLVSSTRPRFTSLSLGGH
jgi:L-asparaginase